MPFRARISGSRLPLVLAALGLTLAVSTRSALAQEPAQDGVDEALAAWVGQLRGGTNAEGAALSAEEEADLVRRIVDTPREAWSTWVDKLAAAERDDPDRRLAVRLLGAGGNGSDIEQLARLAVVEEQDGLLSRSFAASLEAALVDLLQRQPSACVDLRRAALDAPEAVRRSLATALAGVGGPRALEELSMLLGYDPALDPTLLTYIARTARTVPKPADPDVVRQVRRCITSTEPQIIASAAEALGGLEDFESLDLLLGYLEHPETCVRGSAHRALKAIAGVNLPAQRARWEIWVAEERSWFEERAPESVERLASRNRMTLVQGLGEIGMHRLHRHELALEVVVLLERASADERSLACLTLAQLGSVAAVPYLTAALEDDAPQVRGAAWTALKHITGRDLPADATAWTAWTEGQSSS